MFDIIVTTVLNYIPEIATSLITGVGLYVLAKAKELINTKTKKEIVKTTIKYVEQVYKDIHGEEKLKVAKENAIEMLNEKGINITDLELTVLIESCLAEFNTVFKTEQ